MKKLLIGCLIAILILFRWLVAEIEYQSSRKLLSVEELDGKQTLKGYVIEINSQSPALTTLILKVSQTENRYWLSCRNLGPVIVGQFMASKGNVMPLDYKTSPSFKSYLKLKHISALQNSDNCEVENEYYYNFSYYTFRIKWMFLSYLAANFQGNVAGLLAGVLAGDTDLLADNIKESFQVAGLSHVMAISGSNMSLIVLIIFAGTAFLPLRLRLVITSLSLTCFVFAIGLSGAVLRAYFMACISLVAVFFNKPYLSSRAILLVIMVVYIWDPFIIVYDIGFQLSVLATIGIMLGMSLLKVLLPKLSKRFWIQQICLSVSATIATTPLLAFSFGQISLFSLLANLLFAPLLSFANVLGYLLVILAAVPYLSSLVIVSTTALCSFLLAMIDFTASIARLGNISVAITFPLMVLIYLLIAAVYILLKRLLA